MLPKKARIDDANTISDDAISGNTGDALWCALGSVMNHECKVIAH